MKKLAVLENLGLALLLVLLPLAVMPAAEDAFRLPQLFVLSLAVPALLFYRLFSNSRPRIPSAILLLLIYFIWRFASHLHSGTLNMLWLMEKAALLGVALWACVRLGNEGIRQRAVNFLLIGAVLGALYSFAQAMGLDPLASFGGDPGFGSRVYASLGNPIFWGGYLAMVLPFALAPLLQGSVKRPWVLAFTALLLAVSLILTQTRGAWLGSLAALLVLLFLGEKPVPVKKTALLISAALGLFVLFSLSGPLNPKAYSSLSRLTSSFNIHSDGAAGRLVMWRAAAKASFENPLLGQGSGRFTQIFLKQQGSMMNEPGMERLPYRYTADAHNDWLQLAAESGWPSALIFIFLIWNAFKKFLKRKDPLSLAAAASLTAFSVNAVFNFPLAIIPSAVLLWLLIGLSMAEPDLEPKGWRLSGYRLLFAAILLAGPVIALSHLQGSVQLHSGMDQGLRGNWEAAEVHLNKAAQQLEDERAYSQLGLSQLRRGALPEAAASFEKSLEKNGQSADTWANLCLARGRANHLPQAQEACEKALALNPCSTAAWGNLGKIMMLKGDLPSAIETFENAIKRNPAWEGGKASLEALKNAQKSAKQQ